MIKQRDTIMIVVAVFAGILLAILADKYAFNNSASRDTEVDVVPVIHTDFTSPSSQYFNSQSIDPTQLINIAPNNSQQPFNNN